MNAFIKYYMDKAGLHLVDNEYGETVLVFLNDDDKLDDPERAINTFAELLIRHCAEVALHNDFDPYEGILKEFGIQEVLEEPHYEDDWVRMVMLERIK